MSTTMQQDLIEKLEQRLGRVYTQQRLGIEREHEQMRGYDIDAPSGDNAHASDVHRENRIATQSHREYWLSTDLHPKDWRSVRSLIRNSLKLTGLYGPGHRNTERIEIRHNDVKLRGLALALRGLHNPAPERPPRGHERGRNAAAH